MFKMYSGGLAALSAIILSSCTDVPQLDIEGAVTVAQIIDRIQCEAFQAAQKYPKLRHQRWVGVADPFLQVDDNAGLARTLAYIQPLAGVGTQFVFGASATRALQSQPPFQGGGDKLSSLKNLLDSYLHVI